MIYLKVKGDKITKRNQKTQKSMSNSGQPEVHLNIYCNL